MIQLAVKYKDYEWLDSYDNQLLSIARYHGKSTVLGYSKEWGFCFNFSKTYDSKKRMSDFLDLGYMSFHEELNRYHGVKVLKKSRDKIQNIRQYILERLNKGQPVLCEVDKEFLTIKGFDEENDIIYFSGKNQESSRGITLSVAEFERNCRYIHEINIKEVTLQNSIVAEILNYMIKQFEFLDSSNKIMEFKERMETDLDTEKELRGYEEHQLDRAPIIYALKVLQCRRKKVGMLMKYLSERVEDMENLGIHLKFDALYQIWGDVRSNLIKYHLSKSPDLKEKILSGLEDIAVKESRILDIIKELERSIQGNKTDFKKIKCATLKMSNEKMDYSDRDIKPLSSEDGLIKVKDYLYVNRIMENHNPKIKIKLEEEFFTRMAIVLTSKNENDGVKVEIVSIDDTVHTIESTNKDMERLTPKNGVLDSEMKGKILFEKMISRNKKIKSIEIITGATVNAITFINDQH